jgi:hypothetical protein
MMVTMRSSSSELRSPALKSVQNYLSFTSKETPEKHTQNAPLVQVDICLLADQVGVAATDTLDLCQGVHDLALSVNICVEETEDVLELLVLLGEDEGHGGRGLMACQLCFF